MSLVIPQTLIDTQRRATDPALSAWVSANAGSGKTFVLVRRVLRLLLDGVDPARLLCLTFTNAAAAQMASRIGDELGKWALADDETLAKWLADILGRPADQKETSRARRLFAQAIETPGRLKIQTIHAFCERVLHLFPFEANVPADFSVLDDVQSKVMIDEALARVLAAAAARPQGEEAQLLDTIFAYRSDSQMRDALKTLINQRSRFRRWRESGGTAHKSLGVDPVLARDDVLDDFANKSAILAYGIANTIDDCMGCSTDTMQSLAKELAATTERLAHADILITAFLTKEGKLRSKFPFKHIKENCPVLKDAFDQDSSLVEKAYDDLLAIDTAAASEALFIFAVKVLDTFDRIKAASSSLDFDDLIQKMGVLLESGHGPWVLYRLDRGIDHILVDEAQDTSPEQWRIIRALAEEFFAGEGARELIRTIFAVGDEKQSIYSFQGADPHGFVSMKSFFQRRIEQAELSFKHIQLTHSFRTTPQVLGGVDAVFDGADAARGLAFGDAKVQRHAAIRSNAPGLIEIWPPVAPADKPESDPWDLPFDRDDDQQAPVLLAKQIAAKIKSMIEAGIVLPSTGKPANEGDFLILLRKRGRLARPLVRAMKDAGLKVAGADRLQLTSHIAVQDLMGLGTACWLPDDDLNLAATLKSPLFGLSEDDVYNLAEDRKGSLYAALRDSDDPALRAAYNRLEEWRMLGQSARPFDFYAAVLGAGGGRDKIHGRLGAEALDPVDEFLSLALSFESGDVATLPGFLHWLRSGEVEIKRDMDEDSGEIRIMTVHGSKGLEAPVVFLPDTMSPPNSGNLDPVLFDMDEDDIFAPPKAAVWMPGANSSPQRCKDMREAALIASEEEYRRLLYVGMTRAEDRLYICGAASEKTPSKAFWHQLVETGLTEHATEVESDDGIILRIGDDTGPTDKSAVPALAQSALPDWLLGDAPKEQVIKRKSPSLYFANRDNIAIKRGTLVHRLLEILPDLPEENRRGAGANYLQKNAPEWAMEDRDALLGNIFAILNAPEFADLFAPGSQAEVAVAGYVGEGEDRTLISGVIDRLILRDDSVLIVDFKSDASPPRPGSAPPSHYSDQLAAYAAVLTKAYPDRRVDKAILWTAIPRMDILDSV